MYTGTGSTGGLYGGGGSSGGSNAGANTNGGAGAPGVVVITFTPVNSAHTLSLLGAGIAAIENHRPAANDNVSPELYALVSVAD
jgi:hypothetical protein